MVAWRGKNRASVGGPVLFSVVFTKGYSPLLLFYMMSSLFLLSLVLAFHSHSGTDLGKCYSDRSIQSLSVFLSHTVYRFFDPAGHYWRTHWADALFLRLTEIEWIRSGNPSISQSGFLLLWYLIIGAWSAFLGRSSSNGITESMFSQRVILSVFGLTEYNDDF